jgi:hypothetical protein
MQTRCAIVFLFVFINNCLFAQLSVYHGVIFPYESSGRLPQTVGGVSVAVPDFISGAQSNPAGLAFYQSPLVYANLHLRRLKLTSDFASNGQSIALKSCTGGGQFSGLIPVRLFGKKMVFAFSALKIDAPEFENIPMASEADHVKYTRTGTVWNTTLGISSRLFNHLTAGVSVTKWFGQWKWQDEFTPPIPYLTGNGTYKYTGINLSAGLMHQFDRFSWGMAIHSPFTLMKCYPERSTITSENFYHYEQKFTGMVSVGISYRFYPQFLWTAGFCFQNKMSVKEIVRNGKNTATLFVEKFGGSHQANLGGEYVIKFRQVRVPVFLAYRAIWLPKTENSQSDIYELFSSGEKKKISHSVIAGLNLEYQSYGFYLTTQWNSSKVDVLSSRLQPPES